MLKIKGLDFSASPQHTTTALKIIGDKLLDLKCSNTDGIDALIDKLDKTSVNLHLFDVFPSSYSEQIYIHLRFSPKRATFHR